MSLKDQIIAAALKRKTEVTPVVAWGVNAYVRVMTGTERDAWEQQMFVDGKPRKDGFHVLLLVKTLSDSEGNRLFTEPEIATLAEFDCAELDRLFDLATELNRLRKADVDKLTKNS